MSTSTEQTSNPSPGLPNKKKPGFVLASVAILVAMLLGGSLFWMVQGKGGSTPSKPQAKVTRTASPTWFPTPITPPALSMFYDTFINNYHGWPQGSNGGYYRILTNNSLILSDTNPNTPLVESAPTLTNLDNYVVSVDFTISLGDAHDGTGLYLRGDSTLDHDYRVDINGDNTFAVAKEYLDSRQSAQETMLVPSTPTNVLHAPGQLNTLTVILIGPALTVEINNVAVATVNDAAYTNGQIALFARHGATSHGVIVTFTRFEIDRLAPPFAHPTPTPSLVPSVTATAGQP